MVAIVASVDLWAGDPQRVSVGLVTNENELVSYGTVDLAFSYIGTAEEPVEPQPGPKATATFIPTYGTDGTAATPRRSPLRPRRAASTRPRG